MATEPKCLAGPSTAGPSRAARKLAHRYQHFIPQFLLKNFAHKYAVPDYPDAARGRRRDPKTGIYSGEPVVNSLRLSDGFPLEECPVRRICGLENMYEDTENLLKDHGHLEKKFAALESTASSIYRKIVKAYKDGQDNVWLTRTENDLLRKFMFLLTLRSVQYHRKYNLDNVQDYDGDDKVWLQEYMAAYDFTKPIDVWLQSLEAIIDLEIDPGGNWKECIKDSIYFPIADMFIDHIDEMYMTICTPDNHVEEFILTDNCCNVCEGRNPAYYGEHVINHLDLAPCFHKFGPISPKLMIVLRSSNLPQPLNGANPVVTVWRQVQKEMQIETRFGSKTKSMLEDLPIRKAQNIFKEEVKGELVPRTGRKHKLGENDNFCFTIFKIPTHHVRIINGLLIDYAFHGSRIIFFRKKVFLDLIEWFLTEPCEVGKNLDEKHGAKQLAYLKGLSQFMQREGREVTFRWKFAEIEDLEQLHVQNVAATKFSEDPNRGKGGIGLQSETIYQQLGGTTDSFKGDMTAATIMFETWTMSVDFNYGSPEYESLCRRKLKRLLAGHQGQPSTRFWLFLKKMRLAQTTATLALQSIQDVTSFIKEGCQGPEDVLAYAHSIVPDREINVAMYKAFNQSMAVLRGPGRGLESMGNFSLFGDEKWRLSKSSSGQDEPCETDEMQDKIDEKPVRPASRDNTNGEASAESPCQNQQLKAKEEIDVKKATCSSKSRARKRKTSTGIVEPTKRCDNDKKKDETNISETVCTAVQGTKKPACSSSYGGKKRKRQTRPEEQQPEPRLNVQIIEVGLPQQSGYFSQFRAWGKEKSAETIANNKKLYDALLYNREMMFVCLITLFSLGGSLFLFVLGVLSYILPPALRALSYHVWQLLRGIVWLSGTPAVASDSPEFPFFPVAKCLLCAALISGVFCAGFYVKIRRTL